MSSFHRAMASQRSRPARYAVLDARGALAVG
jgi:hypothetical protein